MKAKTNRKLITTLVVVVIFLVVFILLGPFYILYEGQQAVITRFGAIVDAEQESGLKFKMPLIDNVIIYPKKILSWDGAAQRIPTKENQFIWVDTTARWRISDPAKYYETVNTVNNGISRLNDILDSSIRTIISENYLNEAVRNTNQINSIKVEEQTQNLEVESNEDAETLRNLTVTQSRQETIVIGRDGLSTKMFNQAKPFTDGFGIELIDIVVRQIRYSDDLTESVYQRMIKERNQIAEAYRSYGRGQLAQWQGKTESEQRQILSAAYATSEKTKGIADARAAEIYAKAYEADPEFFELWRTLESYRKTIPALNKILSTDMQYFDMLYGKEFI
ncbi:MULTISPECIES: protease modulator HflC [Sphaerochaeta]|jgi:membrane protease subunit HflC|uniref:protease modulator HflC n=1 Tax=Sphaerochaeta TaxID=399320 RepID=UPI0025826C1E|nr:MULTISPECIES: protease modulator HflC [Sphaerochaeta]MDD3456531.1 protease modulator HflC [Sphaerochaeta sp.]MEA5027845.1 protease modulator HflC [Sphaerochaeta associata]MEA5107693.1 protease modulator HflC [Sphaerochaeta associata]